MGGIESVLENSLVHKERNREKHPPTTWALANTKQQGGYLGKLI